MNKLSRISIFITTVIVIVIVCWVKLSQPSVPKLGEFQKIDQLALSPIAFQDNNGKNFTLSDFKGKALILHSWATWCDPCLEELPELAAFYEAFKEKNVVIIALAREPVQREFNQTQLGQLPVYFDPGNKLVQDMMMIAGIPSTLFINARGQVEGIILGKVQWKSKEIHTYVQELIEKR